MKMNFEMKNSSLLAKGQIKSRKINLHYGSSNSNETQWFKGNLLLKNLSTCVGLSYQHGLCFFANVAVQFYS